MQLFHDDTFAAVDDEAGVFCHQRDFAEEDIGLADIDDVRFFVRRVFLTNDEAETRGEGYLVGDTAGEAFVKRPFRFAKLVVDEFKARDFVEVSDRKDFTEDCLQAAVLARKRLTLQKGIVSTLLRLNQIR